MTLGDVLVVILVLVGSAFILLGSFGIFRLPDLYTRMQAATKAGTLGVACVLLGAGVHFQGNAFPIEALIAIIFLFGTAPIASHLIARAAYASGTGLWEKSTRDDLKRDIAKGLIRYGPDEQQPQRQ